MRYVAFTLMIFLSVLSCNVNDLYNTVDRYNFMVRLADLTAAVLDDSHAVDWEALQQLQLRYDVDLVGPTNRFLTVASELKGAYKQLQENIDAEQKTIMSEQELSNALRKINE